MIKIRSKKTGFRRCGLPHPKEAVEYPDDRFSKKELAILRAEKMLVVEIIPDEKVDPISPGAVEVDPVSPGAVEKPNEPVNESAKPGKKGKR